MPGTGPRTFVLSQQEETLTFINVAAEPVPSLLRGFSAPVLLDFDYSDDQLLHLLAHDSDPFNRWEAGQRLALRCALAALAQPADAPVGAVLTPAFLDAMRGILRHAALDAAFKELALTPAVRDLYLRAARRGRPAAGACGARGDAHAAGHAHCADDWQQAFEANQNTGAYRPDPVSSGKRALAGMALTMLCLGADSDEWPARAFDRFKQAGNMTDRLNALAALVACAPSAGRRGSERVSTPCSRATNWCSTNGLRCRPARRDRDGHILPLVRQLMSHPDFHLKNPNRARSLLFSYCSGNPAAFHRKDAAGYQFWSLRVLEIDAFNPQLAARLARALDRWSRLAEPYRSAAREAIARVAAKPDLSNDVREVVSRALAD